MERSRKQWESCKRTLVWLPWCFQVCFQKGYLKFLPLQKASCHNKLSCSIKCWSRIHLQCRRHKRHGFNLWVRKIPWRRAWQPTSVFLPGESHGQRSLAGYSPKCLKELDTTRHLSIHTLNAESRNSIKIIYHFFKSQEGREGKES